jgi:hypothetical protein
MRHIDLIWNSFFCDMRLLRMLRCSGEEKPPHKLTPGQGGPDSNSASSGCNSALGIGIALCVFFIKVVFGDITYGLALENQLRDGLIT